MATINELTTMQTPSNEDNVPIQTGSTNYKIALHNNRSFRSSSTIAASTGIADATIALLTEYVTRYGLAAGGFTATGGWANVSDGLAIMGQVSEPYSNYVSITGIAVSKSATGGCIAFRASYQNGARIAFASAQIGSALA